MRICAFVNDKTSTVDCEVNLNTLIRLSVTFGLTLVKTASDIVMSTEPGTEISSCSLPNMPNSDDSEEGQQLKNFFNKFIKRSKISVMLLNQFQLFNRNQPRGAANHKLERASHHRARGPQQCRDVRE